jgi:outer membrane protein assembly factor BamB
MVFLSSDDLNFYALNAQTGAVLWSKRILPNRAGATVANNMVYIGGGGTGFIYAYDASTGVEKWKFPVPGDLNTSSPCVVTSQGAVYHPGISGEKN